MKSEIVAKSLGAAIILYVAYFSVGVVIEVIAYATAGFRDGLPSFIPWKFFFDASQILIAVAIMRLFLSVYDSRMLLMFFVVFLGATLAAIYNTSELMSDSKSNGLVQFVIAIFVCALLGWKQRL
jgi:hypothetical protein